MAYQCKCGGQPLLCFRDSTEYVRSLRSYEQVRYYRYICPVCHEWASPSINKTVALRHWNRQMTGERKTYWHNADLENSKGWAAVDGDFKI